MPELPLMICHCYLSKVGLQAVYVISLLHHLWAVSFSRSKLLSFKWKGVTWVYLGLRGNKRAGWGNFLCSTMRSDNKRPNIPPDLSLGQDIATAFNTKTQTTADNGETYFTLVIMARKVHCFKKKN